MKSKFLQLLPFLIVAGIAAVLFLLPRFGPPRKSAKPKDRGPTAVTTVRVARGDLRETYQTVGTVAGQTEIKITSQVEGVLQEVAARIGERVKKGQTLARLDDRLLRPELTQAEAALKRSSEELKRVQQLANKGIAEAKRLEAAAVQQQMDQAAVEKFQTQLSLSRFSSPFDGIVTAQFAYLGDTIRSGSPVFALADVARLRVFAKVPDTIATRLKQGAAALLRSDAGNNAEFPAIVAEIYPAADPVSHQTTIELDAGDVFPRLQPGFLVKIQLELAEHKNALTLDRRVAPDAAAHSTIQLAVVHDGQAELRKVQLGVVLENQVEIVSGLNDSDAVVLRGGEKLKNGDAVRVIGEAAVADKRVNEEEK